MTKAILRRRPRTMLGDPLFRRFFDDDVFNPQNLLTRWNETLGEEAWLPAVDIREDDDKFVFTAELPGLTREQVDITIEEKVLTISGERNFESKEDNKNYHRIERSYGSFSRSFSLPHDIDQEGVNAAFENGLLEITLPKSEATKPRRIEIG
jgi:HSP20 family protein